MPVAEVEPHQTPLHRLRRRDDEGVVVRGLHGDDAFGVGVEHVAVGEPLAARERDADLGAGVGLHTLVPLRHRVEGELDRLEAPSAERVSLEPARYGCDDYHRRQLTR